MSVEAFARILSCCAVVVVAAAASPVGIAAPAGIAPAPQPAMTEPKTQAQPPGPSTCIDGMETEPDYDDQDPTPVSDTVDGGCLTSPQPIST